MKKLVYILCSLILSFSMYVMPVHADEASDQTAGIEVQTEAGDSDLEVTDGLGTAEITIEDKGDFHPDTRDAIEMIAALAVLIIVVGLILHFCDPSEKKEDKDNKSAKGKSLIRMIGYVAVLAVMFLFFRFVIANVKIPSASMETTLMVGDRCAINRLSYIGAEPERGDIVIFKNPEEFGNDVIIKRIIGLPGDHISFMDGQVYINGELAIEEYLDEGTETLCDNTYDVPEGCYFLMGDNRGNSDDSRYWTNPYLSGDRIMGKHILTIHFGKKN